MAGRKKTPDALKIIKGTDQRCRMSSGGGSSIVISKVPSSPKWLSTEARRIWKSVALEMINLKLLTTLNAMNVAIYCDLLAQYLEVVKKMNESNNAMTIMAGKTVAINPLITIKSMTVAQIMKISNDFGFTPASQSRILGTMKAVNEEENDYDNL